MPNAETTAAAFTVVIVNWNGAELLPGCLDGLHECGADVVVVDNASEDASCSMIADSYPWVTLLANEENLGFAVANNQGLGVARTPLVLLLNNDTVTQCTTLDSLAAFFDAHPQVGIAGPTLVNTDGTRQPSCGPGPNLWTELLARTLLHRLLPGVRTQAPVTAKRVDWVTGAALAIRRDLALELQGLDEGMFMFYEDLDLCARAREAGWEVWFLPTEPIVHLGGASRRRVEAESLIHSYRSTRRFFDRHGPRWRRQLLQALNVPEFTLRMALWGVLSLSPSRRALASERLRAYRRILHLAVHGDNT